eukprot:COSAG01_NODE_19477_length_1007_cov_13.774229_1_plen_286_part_10
MMAPTQMTAASSSADSNVVVGGLQNASMIKESLLLEIVPASNARTTAQMAEAAREQAAAVKGLRVEGHPVASFNGIYKQLVHKEEEESDGEVGVGFPRYSLDFWRAGSIYTDGEAVEGQNLLWYNAQQLLWVLGPSELLVAAEAGGGSVRLGQQGGRGTAIASQDGRVPVGEHAWRRGGAEVRLLVTELATDTQLAAHDQLVRDSQRARFKKWPVLLFGAGPCIAAVVIIVLCAVWRSEARCDETQDSEHHLDRMLAAAEGRDPEFESRIEQCQDYKDIVENSFFL